jgi:hypothetical protein
MSLAIRPEITSSFRDDEEQADAAVPLLAAGAPTRSRSHAGDVHILSAAFLFVFSAYLPTQNLQSTLNTVSTYVPIYAIELHSSRSFCPAAMTC